MKKKTLQEYKHQKTVFCSIRSLRSLCELLRVEQRKLLLMAQDGRYKTFTIPKRGGGQRQIENPGTDLKRVQHRLNGYLQSVYFFEKSHAAYGFILGVKNDDDRRNVLSNARKHIGKPWLLNIDLKNFFHTVSKQQVVGIFKGEPFRFKNNIAELLADLCTYKEHLPMGASTSPVLSNFASRKLDETLTQFSTAMLWVYTRYADDMSFSSSREINVETLNSVRELIAQEGFVINEKKLQIFGPNDDKVVTGLLVGDKVSLAPHFLSMISAEVEQLTAIYKSQNEQGQISTRWVEQFKQQVRGRINFAGFVLGRQNASYIKIKDDFYTAINPPVEEFGAISWRGFPYNL